MSFDNYINIKT